MVYDPLAREQVMAGQVAERNGGLFFDSWASFTARSERQKPAPSGIAATVRDYRIEATIDPDLSLSAVTRVTVQPVFDGLAAIAFEITPQMEVTAVSVDGRPAECLQRESVRTQATHGGNQVFVVAPPEPLRVGHAYEFEFRHTGRVIADAGDRVLYLSARGNWYPLHSLAIRQLRPDLPLSAGPGPGGAGRCDGGPHRRRLAHHAFAHAAPPFEWRLSTWAITRARAWSGADTWWKSAPTARWSAACGRAPTCCLCPRYTQSRAATTGCDHAAQPTPEPAPDPLERPADAGGRTWPRPWSSWPPSSVLPLCRT